MPQRAATVFSWTLSIGDFTNAFEKFGNLSISHSLSGYGTSGVVTSTMSVSTYNDPELSSAIPINAEVILSCSDSNIMPPKFYVISRKINGNITIWNCADGMSKAERYLDFSEDDFTDDRISCNALCSKIITKCGFESIKGQPDSELGDIDRSLVEGNSVRSILEMLSTAWVGYWVCSSGDELIFISFGSGYGTAVARSYSSIISMGERSIGRLIMSDGNDSYVSGSGNDYQTLSISSQLASQELANGALYRIQSLSGSDIFTYKAWQCERGIVDQWIYLGVIYFGVATNISRMCNNVTLYPSPSGLYFSASNNAVQEDEAAYVSEVQRQLSHRVEMDAVNGNTAISRKGLYFFENEYKSKQTEDPEATVKYGFNVEDGVTEYDGAMVSKITPDSASLSDDGTEAIVAYGNKKYKYTLTYDDSGNITDFEKEEVSE